MNISFLLLGWLFCILTKKSSISFFFLSSDFRIPLLLRVPLLLIRNPSPPSSLSILKVICLFAVQPVCGADQKMVYGVAHGEIASINCTVKANPTAGIRFRWTFNSSAELNTLPQSRYTVSGPTSQVCTYYFSVKWISQKISWKYFHGKNKMNTTYV